MERMPNDPFKECFTEIHDKLYRRVVEIYPATLDGEAFPWAKENRRPIYDAWAQAAAEMDDLWEKTDTDTFKKAVYVWAKAVLEIYREYDKAGDRGAGVGDQKTETRQPTPDNPHNWPRSEEPRQRSLL